MPSILTLALICDHAYNDAGSVALGGARRIHVPNAHRINNSGTSFFGAAYQLSECGIIAFRGTKESEDFLDADAEILKRRLPVGQLGDAFAYFSVAEPALRALQCSRFIVTGHSLGGGLAERVAARVSRVPIAGVTFNAPGLMGFSQAGSSASLNIPTRNQNILNIRSAGDLVSQWGQHIGRMISLPDSGLHTLGPLIEKLAESPTGLVRV